MSKSWRGVNRPRGKKGKKNRQRDGFERTSSDVNIRQKDHYKRHGRSDEIDLEDEQFEVDEQMEAELTE
ncbi:MAG: hypothetical protein AB1483_00355 [Candidatus Zixiibacteriota bacterium]